MVVVWGGGWRLVAGRLRWLAAGGGAPTEYASCARAGGGSGSPGCWGGASVVGETCERGRLDRRKLVRPRILGCVVVSDSIISRGRGRAAGGRAATWSYFFSFLAAQWVLTDDQNAAQAGQQR